MSPTPSQNPHVFKPNTMHIPQDVVDLIVDQLSLSAGWKTRGYLRAASLVSTAWVDRSQHHLFSTLTFYDTVKIERWCSRIKPDPYGVSRHVRALTLGGGCSYTLFNPRPRVSDIETALPHLVSFKSLQELMLGIVCTSLGVLAPIFSSSPGILKLHRWARPDVDVYETWKDISTLADLLPNLTHVSLSGYQENSAIHIQLSVNEGSSLAINRFKFHELQIAFGIPHSLPFFETSGPHLQVLDLHEFDIWTSTEGQPSPAD